MQQPFELRTHNPVKSFSIANHFVVSAMQGAIRQGHPLETILQGTGISPNLINQAMARVDTDSFNKLLKRLLELQNDEAIGLGNTESQPGTFAILCQLCVHLPNLEVMFKRMKSFYDLFPESPSLDMEVDEEQGVVTLSMINPPSDNDPNHFLKESILIVWHRTACWMADQRINLLEAGFTYSEPDHSAEYRSIFYCPCHFDQQSLYLRFSTEALKYPVVQNERTLQTFLLGAPGDLLARPTKDASFQGKIRSLIGRDIHGEMPSFEDISDQLHMTPQTLRRRLKAENTSYQEIKDNIRRDIAIYLLSLGDLGVNDIALKVGFTEPSTFHRAFKKWTGVTPSVYRDQLSQQP